VSTGGGGSASVGGAYKSRGIEFTLLGFLTVVLKIDAQRRQIRTYIKGASRNLGPCFAKNGTP